MNKITNNIRQLWSDGNGEVGHRRRGCKYADRPEKRTVGSAPAAAVGGEVNIMLPVCSCLSGCTHQE